MGNLKYLPYWLWAMIKLISYLIFTGSVILLAFATVIAFVVTGIYCLITLAGYGIWGGVAIFLILALILGIFDFLTDAMHPRWWK